MSVNSIYTSVACNIKTGAADWSDNNLILFAACNSVALLNPKFDKSNKIIKTYTEHSKRVNAVKWIPKCTEQSSNQFVSVGDDCLCIHWILDVNQDIAEKFHIKGHTESITAVDSLYVDNCLTIITVSSDSTIKLWQRKINEYNCLQSICLNGGLCLALRAFNLKSNHNCTMIAFSTDDHKVYLYGRGEKEFIKVETLVGHEDWVRALDFIRVSDDGDIILASGSQDTFIRLWRLSLCISAEQQSDDPDEIKVEERQLSLQTNDGEICKYSVSLESVLSGHDGWITGLNWHQRSDKTIILLSSSMDKTIIIWSLTDDDGTWSEKVRVGDVGGNSLGFLGTKFAPTGQSIFGHGFHGGLYLWHQSLNDDTIWTPGVVVGGHSNEVRDLAWDPTGTMLYTVSADQTTRIHTPWRKTSKELETVWHELARPQVHGYDMQAISVLSRYSFASAAEEKIVRIFHAPGNFVKNLRRIGMNSNADDVEGNNILNSNSKGASVPSLGLSNKEIYDDTGSIQPKHVKDEYSDQLFVPVIMDEPPSETTLMQSTLWPESQKLYGHGYDIFALASTSDGKILASSCKATNAEHAQIIIWNVKTWKQIQKLSSHQLTITQMKFSPDNRYLLSVGRDRKISVFKRKIHDNDEVTFSLIAHTDKTNGIHTRIIWTCDWSHDSKIFATGSRDGKLVAWHNISKKDGDSSSLGSFQSISTYELKNESITAVAFAKFLHNESYLVSIGLECGHIKIILLLADKWTNLLSIDSTSAHHLTVKKLAFRPNCQRHQLASCGEDHIVRIHELKI